MLDWNGNGRLDPVDIGISIASEIWEESTYLELMGYPFLYIQELEPKKNFLGKAKQYDPKISYLKRSSTPLNNYGSGPFCKFKLISKGCWGVSGVYALLDNQGLLYIGQTRNLAQRFNAGYGNISPRNCYIGGQSTNCKINSMILSKYQNNENVYLFFCETDDYDRFEQEIIDALEPPYNGSNDIKVPKSNLLNNNDNNAYSKLAYDKNGANSARNYDALKNYLLKQASSTVVLSFKEIEGILGNQLPKSAYIYPAWWSNSQTESHPHSKSWQDAGFKTSRYSISIWENEITFIKK